MEGPGEARLGDNVKVRGRLVVTEKLTKLFRAALGGAAIAAVGMTALVAPAPAEAQQQYIPGIWIDPDGCEHWVMDDGAEGFMSPHRDREGRPVCRRAEICGVVPTDTLFATDEAWLMPGAKDALMDFFRQANAFGFLISGHTDSRASDEYNIDLSNRRAAMVASIAQDVGVRVVDVRGFGERQPRATNHTAAGMQQNRRVEIYCLR